MYTPKIKISCEFCEKYDFSRARVSVSEYAAYIELALCHTRFPKEQQFNFCPICGRRLKDGAYNGRG